MDSIIYYCNWIIFMVVLVFSSVSCAHKPQWQGQTELLDIAADFYLQWDERTGEMHPVNDMDIDWMTPKDKGYVTESTIGFWVCGTMTIRIDRDAWAMLDGYEKEQLVFHELGHFIFMRDHDTDTFTCYEMRGGCPYSLMYPEMIPSAVYRKHHELYMTDLFGG